MGSFVAADEGKSKGLRSARLVVPPGRILKQELEERGWTPRALATRLKRPEQVVCDIINGITPVTPEASVELSRVLGTSPEFWYNLETDTQK